MFAYITRRVLATIPLLIIALYLVFVGVSMTSDPRADFYLCLPRCQDGFDRITEVYNLDVPILAAPVRLVRPGPARRLRRLQLHR